MPSVRNTLPQLHPAPPINLKRAFSRRLILCLLLILGALSGSSSSAHKEAGAAASSISAPLSSTSSRFGELPLYFIENRGQLDPRVGYYIQGRDQTIYFTGEGVTYALSSGDSARHIVKLDFIGARRDLRPEGSDPAGAVFSYFKGPRDSWKSGLRTFSSIIYRDVWPGIDLVYDGTVSRMKYSFIVRPGADPRKIKLAYRGAQSVRLDEAGRLTVTTPRGRFADDAPVSFQQSSEGQREIATSFRLEAAEGKPDPEGRVSYGFDLGSYDPQRMLIIDPAVLIYSGYIGGGGEDRGESIAVDGTGNVYVAGFTASTEATFPVTVGPDLSYNGGLRDAFVAKVNAAGTALIYLGYIGGSNSDHAHGIAVDGGGNATVVGNTFSSQATFPVAVGPDLTHNGGSDGFIARVNAAGTALVYCGYIGGNGTDIATAVVVDGPSASYVSGYTESSEVTFPVAVGPDLTHNSGVDAFITKVDPQGLGFVYSGFVGGAGDDYGRDIAVDGAGGAYLTGDTNSDQTTFPVAVGPDLSYNGGLKDAFVAKINAGGASLGYAGYLGGTQSDVSWGIAVDGDSNAYLTGETESSEETFPVVIGPNLRFSGDVDVFVAKLNAAGTSYFYSGYLGGTGIDRGLGIALDSDRNVYLTGETSSIQSTFPVLGGPQLNANGVVDAFVAKLNTSGRQFIYSGFLGGVANDFGLDIAVDGNGNAYVTGYTESNQTTFPVLVGPDLTFGGGVTDGFVAKIERRADTTPPTIALAGNVVRAQGGSASSALAFVSDLDTLGGNIFVGVRNIPAGISIVNLTNNRGEVTADVAVTCAVAPGNYTALLEATDSAGLRSTANLQINVTPNTPPVLGTYPLTSIPAAGGVATVTPSAPPSDNGSIATAIATAPNFTGALAVNPTTGVVTIANAGPEGTYTVTVTATDNCGGNSATTFTLNVGQVRPVPRLTALSPNFILAGSGEQTITITGEGFVPTSVVRWNGADHPTTFVNAMQLTVRIPAALLVAPGTAAVTVFNTAPGGGVSNPLSFTVASGLTVGNAASYVTSEIAPGSVAVGYGTTLALSTEAATDLPLPTNLGGTTVKVIDSKGDSRDASLFYVSRTQINFHVPEATALGPATVLTTNSNGIVSADTIEIVAVAPGVFSANADASGIASALIFRITAAGIRTYEPVARFDPATNRFVPIPIDLGPSTDQVFLLLYTTGLKGITNPGQVTVNIGGSNQTISAVAPSGYVGVEQVNVLLSRALAGRGEVDVALTAAGKPANTVKLVFR